jgi:hypothetical protein
MGEVQTFAIRRAFVVPLALLVALTLALLIVCLVQDQPVAKVVILAGLLLPLGVMLIESAGRRLEVSNERIRAVRPFRSREIVFSAVTALETVKVRSRVFMTLMAGEDDYLIISNSYADFPGLVNRLIAAVPESAVTEETRQLAVNPPVRQADIASVWLAVIAMTYILVAQFLR